MLNIQNDAKIQVFNITNYEMLDVATCNLCFYVCSNIPLTFRNGSITKVAQTYNFCVAHFKYFLCGLIMWYAKKKCIYIHVLLYVSYTE